MNSRERVDAVFQGRMPDRVPVCHLGFSSEVASALLGREAYVGGGIQQWREATALWQGEDAHEEFLERSFRDAADIALLCEHDIIRPSYWRYNRKPTRRLDENTFLYEYGPEEDWKVLRYDPGSEQCNVFDYVPRPMLALEDLDRVVEAAEAAAQSYEPAPGAYEMEVRARALLGHERVVRVGAGHIDIPTDAAWLQATILRPDLVGRYLDAQAERAEREFRFLAGQGFRYFFGGGDLASNDGPMYSPRTFHELMLPRVRRIAQACHECGGRLLYDSDGNLWPVADDLFGSSGVDGYYEIDRRAGMDLGELRRRFPDLTLMGNMSSITVATRSRDEVIAETRSCLDEAHRSGRIIVGTSNYFVPHTPIENVRAVLETIARYR